MSLINTAYQSHVNKVFEKKNPKNMFPMNLFMYLPKPSNTVRM